MIALVVESDVEWRLKLVVNGLEFVCTLSAASKEDAERLAKEVASAVSTQVCRVRQD